ncbi:unnamed protein product [Microthlaspi erraticum]|uniref:Uncharacterized protein n=1 Tax=Microthlaspi erraticum TaxID=1685480 RepID=A0A6D2IJ75_9BRAS|nr:unnamed protein product [Microthlaspi erraticum]
MVFEVLKEPILRSDWRGMMVEERKSLVEAEREKHFLEALADGREASNGGAGDRSKVEVRRLDPQRSGRTGSGGSGGSDGSRGWRGLDCIGLRRRWRRELDGARSDGSGGEERQIWKPVLKGATITISSVLRREKEAVRTRRKMEGSAVGDILKQGGNSSEKRFDEGRSKLRLVGEDQSEKWLQGSNETTADGGVTTTQISF